MGASFMWFHDKFPAAPHGIWEKIVEHVLERSNRPIWMLLGLRTTTTPCQSHEDLVLVAFFCGPSIVSGSKNQPEHDPHMTCL
jgi:hypothetical protein